MVLPDVPRGGNEGEEQPSGKNSACLKRIDAENFSGVRRVIAPLIDHVQHLCADDAAQDDQNPKIPSMVSVVAQALGIPNADPKTKQDSRRHKESVCG